MKKSHASLFIILSLVLCVFASCIHSNEAKAKQLRTLNDAKQAAKKQVPSAQITEIEMKQGAASCEVSMRKGSKEYDLKFPTSDGKLIEYEWELPNTSYSMQNKPAVSNSTIKKKALKQVKKGKIVSIKLKVDDGLQEYKVSLTKGKRQYTLVYNAKNAKLLEYKWKLVSSNAASSNKYIGEQKARKIALAKAPGATVTKFEFDHDDGIAVYEIEMKKDGYEYDVKIDAKTGEVIEFEKEFDD